VGLLYGPSGCGKSSLARAGLVPRLAPHVIAVHVEATVEDTEARLLRGLRRHCPDLADGLGLVESLAELRRGRGVPAGKKVLLVLDQFEQWLHARRGEQNAELVQALRQCDGGRVQAIVLVRDDFWMATTRFMQAVEIDLVPGQNLAAVDLFDPPHARKVLAGFGRAYGRLPDDLGQLSKDQHAFLDQAVAGLSQDGKVISVRLALFAEMVKGRPWAPATLKEVGGTAGVGVTFLEETFSASAAPPQHRLHQKAAQAVLKALLPETGTDIRGHMRSRQELLGASGYGSRPRDFDALLRILDGELRLITPTDPEGVEMGGQQPEPTASGQYYQLTHDYLVPSLRVWLTRKQKETRRGRAELRLAERAALWQSKPQSRHLPAWWEWASIRLFTRKRDWTPPQRRMMRKAGHYHALRGAALGLLLAAALAGGLYVSGRVAEDRAAQHAADRVAHLGDAEVSQVRVIVDDLGPYRAWADPRLRDILRDPAATPKQRLHASLALLPTDAGQADYLRARLLQPDAAPGEVLVIGEFLDRHGQGEPLRDGLWPLLEDPGEKAERRFRAACALARFDPDSRRWDRAAADVAGWLVGQNTAFLGQWLEALRPARLHLLPALGQLFRTAPPQQRGVATDVLADYAADQPRVLADLLLDADDRQFAVIYPKFKDRVEQGLPALTAELDRKLPADAKDDAREKLAKRQANAAVELLRMNQPEKVWPLLKRSDQPEDPRVRSYLIHRFGPRGADAGAIVKRL
jgi:hypothetical protein